MECLRCSKTIDSEEAKKIEEVGVEPFCSEYCCLVYSGVPLPYSQGDGVISDTLNGCYGKRNRELYLSGDEKEKREDCKL